MVSKHMAEHKRNEVQEFGYDKDIHKVIPIMNEQEFFNLLDLQNTPLSNTSTAHRIKFAFTRFVEAANTVARYIKDERESLHRLYLAFLTDI